MYIKSNVIEAYQFWSFADEEDWPDGVYSNDEATPTYYIDINETPTAIVSGDFVVYTNPVTVLDEVTLFNNYYEHIEEVT